MKRAGARDPVKFSSKEELVKLLNAGLPKRAELQPPFLSPGKLEDLTGLYHGDVSLPLTTQRSYASMRSILRYLLIEATNAIKRGREHELLGWEAQFTQEVDPQTNNFVPDQIVLRVRGWFRKL